MVYLTPRFVFLAALVATAAMPTFVLQSEARAVGLMQRHQDQHKSDASTDYSTSRFAKVKGKSVAQRATRLPASKKLGRSKDEKRSMPLPLLAILRREADPKEHHLHRRHDKRQEQELTQATFSLNLNKRARSRIYGNRVRQADEAEMEELLRAAQAEATALKTTSSTDEAATTWDPLDPLIGIGNAQIGDGRHGTFSDTHHLLSGILRRSRVHARDINLGEGDQEAINLSEPNLNANANVHNRDLGVQSGITGNSQNAQGYCQIANGVSVNCQGASSSQRKRADPTDAQPGVPGTIDIVAIGGPMKEKLASLVLSSTDAASDANPVNGTDKATEDINANAPFVLDASNATQTQFFLVAKSASAAAAPASSNSSSSLSTSYANTVAALKKATSSKADDIGSADIPVLLKVPVFDRAQALMSYYCATFDPNPPKPAPLTVEKCFDNDSAQNQGKLTETSLHKSQTFAYNPVTGTVRPQWFSVTGGNLPNSTNSTEPSANSTDSSPMNSTTSGSGSGSGSAKQMNFKIPTSVKNTPIAAPVPLPAALPGPVTGVVGNVTQTVNGTVSGAPIPGAVANNLPDPTNVTLVFTPNAPEVRPNVAGSSAVASDDPNDTGDDVDTSSSMSMSSATASESMPTDSFSSATSTDASSSESATATESASDLPLFRADVPMTTSTDSASASDATDGTSMSDSMAVSTSMMDSSAAAPTPTSDSDSVLPTTSIEEAAIEKMYQSPHTA